MEIKTIGIMALMFFVMSFVATAIGNFTIQYPQGTDLFKVLNNGNVTVGTLIATTWLDVQTDIDLPDNTVDEVDILFATSCAAGNHLYINGGNLACEADATGGNSTADIQAVAVGGNLTGTVGNAKLVADSVSSDNIIANAVKASELDVSDVSDDIAGDIAEGELADSIVVSADIKDGTIAAADLANVYRLESWDNITGIPTATPSDGDTTHLSNADEIYDYIASLSYLADVVDDTTPQLGGNLDIQTYNITSGGGTAMMIDATENFIIVLGG